MRRVFAVWLILIGISAAVVLLARLNRVPNRLQALGFDVCNGDLCWRGVKLGMDWVTVRNMFPNADVDEEYRFLTVFIDMGTDRRGAIHISFDSNGAVDGVGSLNLDIKLGELVARFGPPLCVKLISDARLELIYPRLIIDTFRNRTEYSLTPDERIPQNRIAMEFGSWTGVGRYCSTKPETYEYIYPWRGFHSKLIR